MNAITRQLIVTVGPMVLKSIMDSILKENKLTEYRDKMVAAMRAKADTTNNEVDDALVEGVVSAVMAPGLYIDLTMQVVALARQYITHTESTLDDKLLLPILDRIEVVGLGKSISKPA